MMKRREFLRLTAVAAAIAAVPAIALARQSHAITFDTVRRIHEWMKSVAALKGALYTIVSPEAMDSIIRGLSRGGYLTYEGFTWREWNDVPYYSKRNRCPYSGSLDVFNRYQ